MSPNILQGSTKNTTFFSFYEEGGEGGGWSFYEARGGWSFRHSSSQN